jgi:16S rRNA (uracil1498-N3)-methyltransferase
MQRYFIKNAQINHNQAFIEGSDYHHIRNVMRMKTGDKLYICDESENAYLSEIKDFGQDRVLLTILEKLDQSPELAVRVTIALGLTKKDKQEEVLRRITELGASGYLSVAMERSVLQIKDELPPERWRKIVKEAAEQSQRHRLLTIYGNISFQKFLEHAKEYDLRLFAYEEAGRKGDNSLKKILRHFSGKSILILVGPEGGISPKEVKLLEENNFLAVGLGPRILRCETAPLYLMSAVSYELELRNED